MNKRFEYKELEFLEMDQVCWKRYVKHVQDPDEFYNQYGVE